MFVLALENCAIFICMEFLLQHIFLGLGNILINRDKSFKYSVLKVWETFLLFVVVVVLLCFV